MRKPLRLLTRRLLKYLSILVLRKHQPDIIAITGSGQTSIAREAIYTVLHEHFPTRRNIESPDAEFTVPLAIFGVQSYPRSYLSWLKIILKTFLQLVILKKHTHTLVLELSAKNPEILRYWFEITKPKIVVICGALPQTGPFQKGALLFKVPESKNGYLTPYFEVARRLGHHYKIKPRDLEAALAKFTLPKAKINILSGKKGKIIVDSTYFYFPPPLKSVLEILALIPGKKAFYTQDYKEGIQLKKSNPEISLISSPDPAVLKSFDVIALRGNKRKMLNLLETLAGETKST